MIRSRDLLATSYHTILAHTRTFGLYTLLFIAPILCFMLVQYFLLDLDTETGFAMLTPKNIWIGVVTQVVTSLMSLWATIAFIYSTYTILTTGQAPDIRHDLQKGTRMLIPTFLLSLLVSLIITVGFLLLIIPGIIVSLWLTFVYHTYLLEHTTMREAMRRSTALVRGRFWQVFLRLAVLTIVVGAVILAISIIPTILFPLLSIDALLELLTVVTSGLSVVFVLLALTVYYISLKATPHIDHAELPSV